MLAYLGFEQAITCSLKWLLKLGKKYVIEQEKLKSTECDYLNANRLLKISELDGSLQEIMSLDPQRLKSLGVESNMQSNEFSAYYFILFVIPLQEIDWTVLVLPLQ